MPWFIQLIMAIFMIILYIAIFMGMYTSSSYSDKRIFYSFGIGIFEIPVGATVYINYAHREVVSTDIKYLGLLEE